MLFVWLFAMNIATLFKVALTDPGIMPRQKRPKGFSDFSWPPAFKDVVVDGRTEQLKFCDTCFFYRPLRTIHCSTCNNCVSGLSPISPITLITRSNRSHTYMHMHATQTDFDHHCPWVGNCIGVC